MDVPLPLDGMTPIARDALEMELLRFFQGFPQVYYAKLTQRSPDGRREVKEMLARDLAERLTSRGRMVLQPRVAPMVDGAAQMRPAPGH